MESVQTNKDSRNQVDEAAINATLKLEMDKINSSLSKITQLINVTINTF